MVLNLILIGMAVTLDPLPLTAFLVVLPSEHGPLAGSAGGENRAGRRPGRDRGPAHRARGRPKPPKKPPKWQAHVDSMSPWFALGLAPTLQPWVLIGAGAATVVEAKLSSWESFLALFLYCVLASASYLAMETYAVFRPGQSQALLARSRAWISTHTDQVIIAGSLIIGLWLIANSIYLIVAETAG